MIDRTTIRYPYRALLNRLRWGRWTGSRAHAFNAGAEALGGVVAHSMPAPAPQLSLPDSWIYTDPVTKERWIVPSDDVMMLGAALIRCLPEEHERTWRDKDLADIAEDGGQLGKLAATEAPPKHRPTFDEILKEWVENTPLRRRLKPKAQP